MSAPSAGGRGDLPWALALAVFAGLVMLHGLDWGFAADVAVVGGDRILQGELPYRDFWTLYAPGSPAAVAALFALFGRELAVVHGASAALAVCGVLAMFAALRRAGASRALAAVVGAGYACVLWTPSPDLNTYVVPRVLIVVGWERVLRAIQIGRIGPLLVAGAAFGVAAWFKHDVGAYAALGSGIALGAGALFTRDASPLFRRPLRALAALGASAAASVLPVVLAVALVGGGDAWQDLVVFPVTDFSIVRGEDYPGWLPDLAAIRSWAGEPGNLAKGRRAGVLTAEWLLAHAPEWVFVTGVAVLVSLWRRRRAHPLGPMLAVPIACGPFYWMAAHVQQNTHTYSMALLALLALPLLWRASRCLEVRALRGLLLAIYGAYAAGLLIGPVMREVRMQSEQPGSLVLGLPGTRGVRVSARDFAIYRPIADFVRANVPEGEAIYVGLRRHDAVVIGNPSFYYLAGRPAATRYHELHPGVVDRDDVQREMIRAIESKGVRCVIRWNFGWSDAQLDRILAGRRRELPELGSHRLDAHLRRNFEAVERHGEYDVLWRRGAARPWLD